MTRFIASRKAHVRLPPQRRPCLAQVQSHECTTSHARVSTLARAYLETGVKGARSCGAGSRCKKITRQFLSCEGSAPRK